MYKHPGAPRENQGDTEGPWIDDTKSPFTTHNTAPTILALPQGTVVSVVRLYFTGLFPYMCNDVENKKMLLIVLIIHYKIQFDSFCKLKQLLHLFDFVLYSPY